MSREQTRAVLDAAIRDHAAAELDEGEMIVAWVVVAGTRSLDDGGATMVLASDEAVPRWQAKGLLLDALDLARRPGEEPENET